MHPTHPTQQTPTHQHRGWEAFGRDLRALRQRIGAQLAAGRNVERDVSWELDLDPHLRSGRGGVGRRDLRCDIPGSSTATQTYRKQGWRMGGWWEGGGWVGGGGWVFAGVRVRRRKGSSNSTQTCAKGGRAGVCVGWVRSLLLRSRRRRLLLLLLLSPRCSHCQLHERQRLLPKRHGDRVITNDLETSRNTSYESHARVDPERAQHHLRRLQLQSLLLLLRGLLLIQYLV